MCPKIIHVSTVLKPHAYTAVPRSKALQGAVILFSVNINHNVGRGGLYICMYLPTPLPGQDVTQGQFLSVV